MSKDDECKSNETKKELTTKPEEDEELSDLLNSALKDFATATEAPAKKTTTIETKSEDAADSAELDAEWTDDFIRQATQQFGANFSNFLQNDDGTELSPAQVQDSFQKMAEAAMQAFATNPSEITSNNSGDDISSTISQTLQELSQGAENLQAPFSEADMRNMFMPDASGQNAFLPFMQGMMQSLLSKEVLYPSLKDIADKFPAWLEANGGALPADQLRNYERQHELMKRMCAELEKENETDAAEVKQERYNRVFALMQELQDLGQPPAELVADPGPTVPFDPQGNPDLSQCSIM